MSSRWLSVVRAGSAGCSEGGDGGEEERDSGGSKWVGW